MRPGVPPAQTRQAAARASVTPYLWGKPNKEPERPGQRQEAESMVAVVACAQKDD